MCNSLQVILLIAVAGSTVLAEDMEEASTPIRCIQCNSLNDNWCAATDEVLEHADEHSYTCNESPIKGGVAKGCRKTMQYIDVVADGEPRIIRECAYTGENVDGQKRTGNKGIRMYYYQCNDSDNCNGAMTTLASVTTVATGLLVARLL